MLIKLSYGNKATINIGNYENLNPMFNISLEGEVDEYVSEKVREQFELTKRDIDSLLNAEIDKIKNPKKVPPHHRVTIIEGVEYPHVTNIITPETPKIPDIEKHAEVGTALDWSCKHLVEEGVLVLKEDHNLVGKWEEMYLDCLKNMNKRKLPNFIDHSIKCVSGKHRYCGELDAVAEVDDKIYIADFKKTKTLNKDLQEKYFMQMSAYAYCYSKEVETDIEGLMIVSPYKDPIVSKDVKEYFAKFLNLRKQYEVKYGI